VGVNSTADGPTTNPPAAARHASGLARECRLGHPHLTAGLLALAVFATALVCGVAYARHLESRYVQDLSKLKLPLKDRSAALHAAALRRPDTLLLYGSSELTIPNPLRATEFFGKASSGFQVFPIGRIGTSPLIILEDLATVGLSIRAKRVVVSVSPSWFFTVSWRPSFYEGNFSPLGAYALAFSSEFSLTLRRHAAERMLRYARTYRYDPVLQLSLQALASSNPWSPALYAFVWPLGKLEEIVLRLQDHWNVTRYIRGHVALPDDSDEELTFPVPSGGDPELVSHLQRAEEWTSLELVLDALKELGARPLLLSMPLAGGFFDRHGVSREMRQELYYGRLEKLAERYGIPLVDFAAEDEDAAFLNGVGAHLSEEGWRHYDEALDRFYHGALD
jgi:poly-D-alanine transfer protein DltD